MTIIIRPITSTLFFFDDLIENSYVEMKKRLEIETL